ncbi:MAG: SDR family oxidoreductase [Henriciella sp.]|nr:SDR family oxidoreductase [Henriciella sp.]
MRVRNKTIVITGAASGIGRGLALEAATRGAVLALADLDRDGLDKTLQQIEATQPQHVAHTRHSLDVSSLENWRTFVREVTSSHAHVDGIINNAGITFSGTVEDTDYDRFDAVMAVNFMGMVYGTKEFLPLLKQRPEAFIANVSSVYGLYPMKKQAAYCASKYAIRGFTGVLEQELKSTSITVSSIHPGHIATKVVRNAVEAGNISGEPLSKAHQDYILDAFEATGLPASEAAKTILDGIAEKRSKILVGKDARHADWMTRFFTKRFIDRANKKVL